MTFFNPIAWTIFPFKTIFCSLLVLKFFLLRLHFTEDSFNVYLVSLNLGDPLEVVPLNVSDLGLDYGMDRIYHCCKNNKEWNF